MMTMTTSSMRKSGRSNLVPASSPSRLARFFRSSQAILISETAGAHKGAVHVPLALAGAEQEQGFREFLIGRAGRLPFRLFFRVVRGNREQRRAGIHPGAEQYQQFRDELRVVEEQLLPPCRRSVRTVLPLLQQKKKRCDGAQQEEEPGLLLFLLAIAKLSPAVRGRQREGSAVKLPPVLLFEIGKKVLPQGLFRAPCGRKDCEREDK